MEIFSYCVSGGNRRCILMWSILLRCLFRSAWQHKLHGSSFLKANPHHPSNSASDSERPLESSGSFLPCCPMLYLLWSRTRSTNTAAHVAGCRDPVTQDWSGRGRCHTDELLSEFSCQTPSPYLRLFLIACLTPTVLKPEHTIQKTNWNQKSVIKVLLCSMKKKNNTI